MIVIAEIFVAQRESVDALRQQLFDRMLDQQRVAVIVEAGGRAPQQVEPSVGLPQQQRSAVRTHHPAVELRHHLTSFRACELEAGLVTLCHKKSRLPPALTCSLKYVYARVGGFLLAPL